MLNSRKKSVLSFASVTLLAMVSASVLPVPAGAHEAPTGWKYPWQCCSNMDCKEMGDQAISERPEGYMVESTGEVVAYADKRVKDSPDGLYHWCAHQAGVDVGQTICLFVPPKGF